MTCSICRNRRRREVDRALVKGSSLREIARRFNVSRDAVFRHKRHALGSIAKARQKAEVKRGASLEERLTDLAAKAQNIAAKAERGGDLRTALVGLRELTRLLELEARITGQIGAGVEISVGVIMSLDLAAVPPKERDALKMKLYELDPTIPIQIARSMLADIEVDDEPPPSLGTPRELPPPEEGSIITIEEARRALSELDNVNSPPDKTD